MVDAHKNLAVGNVTTPPSPANSGTSFTLGSGQGARMPAVPFNGTFFPSGSVADPTNAEIVRVTALTGDVINTMVRTQEGTTARTVGIGDYFIAGVTAKTLTDIETPQTNWAKAQVNILDYAGDSSGVTANDTPLANAIAALGAAGGIVFFPGGTYLFSAAQTVSANNVELRGIGPNGTIFKSNNATGDMLTISGYGSGVSNMTFQGPGSGVATSRTAGYGVNLTGTESYVDRCDFQYQWNAIGCNGPLAFIDKVFCRYFGNSGIVVNQNSDHRITAVVMDNATSNLPATAGIDVQVTASLLIANCNIIHSNFALNLSPATGVTVPSIKVMNSFFDNSAVGVRFAGAGSVFRSQFTNCWFSSMSTAGILMAPTTAGANVDGITFTNCDILNNIAGTTTGFSVTTGNVGKVKFVGCNIAGWTSGVSIVGGTSFFPIFEACTIGGVSAFSNNTTGIVIATGTYRGLGIFNCDCRDNGTIMTLGTATIPNAADYRIMDNPGINPRAASVAPAVPASTVAATNTSGFPAHVYIRAGTITAISINGVVTGITAAPSATGTYLCRLSPGGTIAITYSVAPTWVWIAD